MFLLDGKSKISTSSYSQAKAQAGFWVVTQNHDKSGSVCRDRQQGQDRSVGRGRREPWEQGILLEQGPGGVCVSCSPGPPLQPNTKAGSEHVEALHSHGRNSGEMWLQGSPGLARSLCQHRQSLLGQHCQDLGVPPLCQGLSPV